MFNDFIHGSNTFITSLKVALPKESQFSNHNPLLLFQQTLVRFSLMPIGATQLSFFHLFSSVTFKESPGKQSGM